MRSRLLTFGALTAVAVFAQGPCGSVETREYSAENGRRIRITAKGNLAGAEMPTGFEHFLYRGRVREGYVLAYVNPFDGRTLVAYDVCDKRSPGATSAPPDFVEVSFAGPPHLARFRFGAEVRATAAVETRDHVLRLIHNFRWIAGSGAVEIETIIENLLTMKVLLKGFKRVSDQQVDAGGTWGTDDPAQNNWTRAGDSVFGFSRCSPTGYCPPPPWTTITASLAANHAVETSGTPAPSRSTIRAAADNSELGSAYPVTAGDITAPWSAGDNQVALCWVLDFKLGARGHVVRSVTYREQ